MNNQGNVATNRTEANRQRRISKASRASAKKAANPPKVPRGTARFIRRKPKQLAWAMKFRLAA
jgi:hypothetical protein